MIKGMLKLRRARLALSAGRFEEALRLVDDPDVRGHLKAERLRERCLEALRTRARELERRGDPGRAAEELDRGVRAGEDEGLAASAVRLCGAAARRDERAAEVRAKLFQARAHADRGELAAALELCRDLDDDEARALTRKLDERRAEARRLVARGRELVPTDPAGADEALSRAAQTDPGVAGLEAACLALAVERIDRIARSELSEGALVAFLPEHGQHLRRRLHGLGAGERARLEAPLQDLVRERVWRALRDGAPQVALRLLRRRSEHLGPDAGLESLQDEVAALVAVDARIATADFERARDELLGAGEALRALPVHAAAVARVEAARARVVPLIEEARAALGEGRLLAARARLLDAAEIAPRAPAIDAVLAAVQRRATEHRERMDEVRGLLARGRLDEARSRAEALESVDAHAEEVALLQREAALRQRAGAVPAPAREARPAEGGADPSGDLILAIEEFGELLVPARDALVIGSEARGAADLPVMANLASRHAEIARRTSFHGGARWMIRALGGAEVRVGDERVLEERALKDGDRVRLAADVLLDVRTDPARPGSLLLLFSPGLRPRGLSGVALLPPIGRPGALTLGTDAGIMLRLPEGPPRVEVFRERGLAGLVVQCAEGVRRDDAAALPRVEIPGEGRVRAGALRATVRPRS